MNKNLLLIVCSLSLSGCAIDNLKTLGGSTYESFDGKFINASKPEINTPTSDNKEKSTLVNIRAAADKDLVNNPIIQKYLNNILNNLLEQWEHPYNTNIKIVISPDQNYSASATRDTIILTQGVINDANSADELAFIIAHELSHILLMHNKSNEYFAKQSAIVSKAANIAMVSSVIDDLKRTKTSSGYKITSKNSQQSKEFVQDSFRIGMSINRLSRDVISSTMSRSDEDEADLLGIDLMVKAGFSPVVYKTVLDRLASSRKFSEEQLKKKKSEFQSVISIASKADKNFSGMNWQSMGYLAANEAATHLLQEFSSRHNSEEARSKDLTTYVKREYRNKRRQAIDKDSFIKITKNGNSKKILDNYRSASLAMESLEKGDILQAEKLAKQAISGLTRYDAYPRLAMYNVRIIQNQHNKAIQNLYSIKNWEYASIQTFSLTSKVYLDKKQYKKANNLLNKAVAIIGTEDPFLPDFIALYKAQGNINQASIKLKQCEKITEKNIINQCYKSAGKSVPKSQKGIIDVLGSFTDMVDI